MLTSETIFKDDDTDNGPKDKRVDLALKRLDGKISNLQDGVDQFSRELQE